MTTRTSRQLYVRQVQLPWTSSIPVTRARSSQGPTTIFCPIHTNTPGSITIVTSLAPVETSDIINLLHNIPTVKFRISIIDINGITRNRRSSQPWDLPISNTDINRITRSPRPELQRNFTKGIQHRTNTTLRTRESSKWHLTQPVPYDVVFLAVTETDHTPNRLCSSKHRLRT